MATFKVGIIGAGGIARVAHGPGWKTVPDAAVVAVADVDRARATALARELGASRVFTDYRDLVKLDLDAVDICTPNQVHTPAVLAALRAGKHVLCEKPLAVTVPEVRKMGQLADRQKLKLMTAQNLRWTAPAVAVKDWAAAGGLGGFYHARVRAMRRAWLPPAPGFIDHRLSGGGPCMDIGVHALDACLWALDFPTPVRVSGTTKVNFAKGRAIPGLWGDWDRNLFSVEDFAAGLVHFDNGATLMLEAAWLGHQTETEDLSFQIYGRNGGVNWPAAEYATVIAGNLAQGTLTTARGLGASHTEEIRAFHECVVNRQPSPVPWTETIKVIAILEAIYRSQARGREVAVQL